MNMIRWVKGATPGKASVKRKCEQESKKRCEETGRTHDFLPSWKTGRSWLLYCEDKNLMYCTYCKDNGKSGKFVTGCNNFRLDALKSHELSEQHKAAKSIAERPVMTKCQAAKAIIFN